MTGESAKPGAAVAEPSPDSGGALPRWAYDAVVVGSGFGGSVTALRLAQAGFRVLLLERGRRFEDKDFPALPPQTAFLPDFSRWSWNSDQGLWDVLDLNEVVSVQAAGYGGGSLLYANVHLRAPESVFDERWPAAYREPGALTAYYDLAAAMLEARPFQRAVDGRLVKAASLKRAASNLGRGGGFFHPPIAVQQKDGANVHGVEQAACKNCGACSTGCPHRAKNSLDHNYLAVAEEYENVHIRTNSEVIAVKELGANDWEVDCVDHLRAKKRTYRARFVFLCAGAVHTTRLMRRSTFLTDAGRRAQRLAGIGYFPGGDAIAVAYDTKERQWPSDGPTITTTLVRWEPDASSFFLIQDGGYARELERLIGAMRAPLWMGRNRVTPSRSPERIEESEIPRSDVLSLSSPLDGVLDAIAAGSFHKVLPEKLRQDLPAILQEIARPLLLPSIVESVIARAWHEKAKRRLPKFLSEEDGPLMRWVFRAVKRSIEWTFGSNEELAGHALQAVVTGGGLPRARIAERVLNFSDERAEYRSMLLAMGRDGAPGALHYDKAADRLTADLELYELSPGYTKEEQLMADLSTELGGELRTNPAWAFLGKPITVHNQGGCRMSDTARHGVVDGDGKVFGCDGLYIMDGAMLSTSVGVNPSATITAIAERNVLRFVRAERGARWPDGVDSPGAAQYRRHRQLATEWAGVAARGQWRVEPPSAKEAGNEPFRTPPVGLSFTETMQGYFSPAVRTQPHDDAEYREHETEGRPGHPATLSLTVTAENLAAFCDDPNHRMSLRGTVRLVLGGETRAREFDTEGKLELFVERYKPYGLGPEDADRLEAQLHASRGKYTTRVGAPGHDEERLMVYTLSFVLDGERCWLHGYKRVRNDPGLDAWRDTSSLFFVLRRSPPPADGQPDGAPVEGAGVVHVDLTRFLYTQLPSMTVTGTDDPARRAWAIASFATFFFGSLQRIYAPGVLSTVETFFRANPGNVRHSPMKSEH